MLLVSCACIMSYMLPLVLVSYGVIFVVVMFMLVLLLVLVLRFVVLCCGVDLAYAVLTLTPVIG